MKHMREIIELAVMQIQHCSSSTDKKKKERKKERKAQKLIQRNLTKNELLMLMKDSAEASSGC